MSNAAARPFITNLSQDNDLRRQRRLQHLLEMRDRIAVMVASREAHGLDDAEEAAQLMYALEATVQREFPALYPRLFDKWLARDANLAHDGTTRVPQCPICQRDAAPLRVAPSKPAAA
jgi:rubrerythrin